jgi:transcriptional regulator GlxA family with amidase domain
MTHHVALFVFPGFQLLDAAGPASVYEGANAALGKAFYKITIVSPKGGAVRSVSGLTLESTAISRVRSKVLDSAFIVGGDEAGVTAMLRDRASATWMAQAFANTGRHGSVCSGSVLLAQWGLIQERRFATHWIAAPIVRANWPELDLDAESIFVEDGTLWTSAGVTAGIDMTLALVERDHGADVVRQIAQRLVLPVRRAGWQSQYSPLLQTQAARGGRYADLIAWMSTRLSKSLTVERLAERAGESVRTFHRHFTEASGFTPAEFVTRQRLELAQKLIRDGSSLKEASVKSGFSNAANLASAFRKHTGLSAAEWRHLHG